MLKVAEFGKADFWPVTPEVVGARAALGVEGVESRPPSSGHTPSGCAGKRAESQQLILSAGCVKAELQTLKPLRNRVRGSGCTQRRAAQLGKLRVRGGAEEALDPLTEPE